MNHEETPAGPTLEDKFAALSVRQSSLEVEMVTVRTMIRGLMRFRKAIQEERAGQKIIIDGPSPAP